MRVLYIDRFFFTELAADTVLLWAAGKLCGAVRKPLRLLFAGLLGAAYALLALFLPAASHWYCKAAAFAGMLLLAYGQERKLLRIALAFLFLCAVYGGMAAAVALAAGEASARGLLFAGLVSLGVCALPFRFSGKRGGVAELRLRGEGGEVVLRAMRDTGHRLSDPFTGKPVIFAGESALTPLFSDEQKMLLGETAGLPPEERLKRLGRGFCLLPIRTVGGSSIVLAGNVREAELDGQPLGEVRAAFSLGEVKGDGCEALVGGDLN